MLKKGTLNAIVDGLMFAVGVGVVFTGYLLYFELGRGQASMLPKRLWGLHRHGWGDVHFMLSLALVTLALVHTALHAAWISATSRRLMGISGWWAVAAGLVLGLVVLGAVYAWERIFVKQTQWGYHQEVTYERPAGERPRRRRRRGDR